MPKDLAKFQAAKGNLKPKHKARVERAEAALKSSGGLRAACQSCIDGGREILDEAQAKLNAATSDAQLVQGLNEIVADMKEEVTFLDENKDLLAP